jgi:hypothetical protein
MLSVCPPSPVSAISTDAISVVDLISGSIFCSECDDFVHSNRLDQAYALAVLSAEEQVARFKSQRYSVAH